MDELTKLYKQLDSSPEGLNQIEAQKKLRQIGYNTLGTRKRFVLLKNIAGQFTDFLVIILLIAALLSFFLGDSRTAFVMLAIVGLNAAIGFAQQYRTEKTLEALQSMLPHRSQVLREGKEKDILSTTLVPGDIVILQAGDSVPADGTVIEQYSFKVNEASLTGESHPQVKREIFDPHHPSINKVCMGTSVLEGEAKIIITATGTNTQFGKIAEKTKLTEDELSPLQKKLREVGRTVAKISGCIMLAMIIYSLVKNQLFDHKTLEVSLLRNIFLFALALAASLVPEGLPATVSVALSLGANRLIKKKAIVKKLAAVETLGSTNVICTDKTGTLTMGKMTVVEILPASEQSSIPLRQYQVKENDLILLNWALCQNVRKSDKGLYGDADDVCLWEGASLLKFNPEKLTKEYHRYHEFSFNPIRKMMSVVVKDGGKAILFAKGNPEKILEKCNLSKEELKEQLKKVDKMAEAGLRVFAFAHKEFVEVPNDYNINEHESKLSFDGFCGIADDIHPEVPEAIKYCHNAGIKIVMITGDYKLTAQATANKIKISGGDGNYRMISGEELAKMTDLQLRENLLHPVVFYQTDPGEKLRIVETLQKMGMVVAVTGDGVNDSLALKKADIGIAMGKVGTDVAKEAADMILLDDNFATIVNAIKEGRIIWDNLRKFLFYVFSSNAGEFMTVFISILFGMPTPLTAIQILSVDLGTDVLPSLALTADGAAKGILDRKVEKRENLLGVPILLRLLYVGVIMGGGAAFNFWLINRNGLEGGTVYAQATAAAWATLVVCQMVNVFEVRGGFSSIKEAFFSNKYLIWSIVGEIILMMAVVYWAPVQNFVGTSALSLHNWLPILSVGIFFLVIEEIRHAYGIKDNLLVRKGATVS